MLFSVCELPKLNWVVYSLQLNMAQAFEATALYSDRMITVHEMRLLVTAVITFDSDDIVAAMLKVAKVRNGIKEKLKIHLQVTTVCGTTTSS